MAGRSFSNNPAHTHPRANLRASSADHLREYASASLPAMPVCYPSSCRTKLIVVYPHSVGPSQARRCRQLSVRWKSFRPRSPIVQASFSSDAFWRCYPALEYPPYWTQCLIVPHEGETVIHCPPSSLSPIICVRDTHVFPLSCTFHHLVLISAARSHLQVIRANPISSAGEMIVAIIAVMLMAWTNVNRVSFRKMQ